MRKGSVKEELDMLQKKVIMTGTVAMLLALSNPLMADSRGGVTDIGNPVIDGDNSENSVHGEKGITAEAASRLTTELTVAPFAVPEGLERRALRSERLEAVSFDNVNGTPESLQLVDFDQDGLNNIEEAMLKTDPMNPDTDGDALLDGWEVHEVNGIDLRAMGASPLHKDVFVEMDYMIRRTNGTMVDFRPTSEEKRRIRASFAGAPVSNPDGVTGINIHLVDGNEVPYDRDLNPVLSEFAALKRVHFDKNRAPIFHYMIWADRYDGRNSSGRSMGIPSSDFIVTLGGWRTPGGTPDQKVGTFIHELGHNFGLKHGGSDHVGYKPNHISVMNYSFQTRGIPFFSDSRFEYQRFSLPALVETRLNERAGLGRSPSLQGYNTIYSSPSGRVEVPAHNAIDWNSNTRIDTRRVEADINGDNLRNTLSSTPNEWGQLIYNGGSIGSLLSLAGALETAEAAFSPFPVEELTYEMSVELETELAQP
jgi:hypothetical protein